MKKTVLITGAAHGLGMALARKFLSDGWQVIATDADDLSMAWMLEEPGATVINMDVASDESVRQAFERTRGAGLRLDLIINNAGIDDYFPLSEAPVERFRRIFSVNLFGGYHVNQVFLPLLKMPGGRIIHIGSESLHLALPFMPYPMTKRLVEIYARALRQELRFSGIDVVVVRPGAINTGFLGMVSGLDPGQGRWKIEGPFRRFAQQASKQIGKKLEPSGVADFVARIASVPNPAAVYRINNSLQLRLMSMLPFCLKEKMVFRLLRPGGGTG